MGGWSSLVQTASRVDEENDNDDTDDTDDNDKDENDNDDTDDDSWCLLMRIEGAE